MNNYTKIKNMMPSEMAKFLNEFDREDVIDTYCTECEENNNGCNYESCPIETQRGFYIKCNHPRKINWRHELLRLPAQIP